ncbi:MAG: DNA cytosine methyltransferase, partial [Deltaproteobacteria bacterium]|nr:DNA cytosine methyltransferase [Deltaproteobacteria bacterium]
MSFSSSKRSKVNKSQSRLFDVDVARRRHLKGKPAFTFVDLFAGIGGFRIALKSNGGTCVFSSEWDTFARKTYHANFGEIPHGDITKVKITD